MTQFDTALDENRPCSVAVVGLPLDVYSSFLRGPALAPRRIREVLQSGSTNWCTEDEVDLSTRTDWRDTGDLELASGEAALSSIEQGIAYLLKQGMRVLSLGGDHSVTYPIIRAYAAAYPDLTLLHIDAHPDLYAEFEGQRFSHACPFARIMEEGLVKRLVQIGIRTMNPHQRQQAERFGVEVISMRDYSPDLSLNLQGPLYISLDLDALDPAFAPGVSHHEPGGFSVRDILTMLSRITAPLVGADIVEYNPVRDHADMTAMIAAKFYKEFVGCLLQ